MKKPAMNLDRDIVGLLGFNTGLGLLFTILLTFPAILYLDSHIMGYPHDGFAYIWRQWWTEKAIFELHVSPANMAYINYPYVGNNPHLVASPLLNLLALPFVKCLGGLQTYNILMLASFALSWPTASLLCYEFCHDPRACMAGGAVYGFFGNKVAHAVGGHLPQMAVFLFPLAALFLYRTLKAPPARRNAIMAGLFIGLSALVDLKHIALFVAPTVAVFVIYFMAVEGRHWNRARVSLLMTAIAVAAVTTVPFLLPLAIGRLSGQLDHFFTQGAVQHSADLTSFLVPPPEHPLYSRIDAVRSYSSRLAQDGWHENIFYIGIVSLLLSIFALVRLWRRQAIRFWAVLAVIGIVLALGPVLKVGGEPVAITLGGRVWSVPLPYSLLQHLPFYDWGRTPGRVIGVAMLAMAVLTACGTQIILSHFTGTGRALVAWMILILILADTLFVWPWPMGDAQAPSFYGELAADGEDYAILDLPLWEYRCERYQIYYATIHNHPIVGGIITRRSPEAEESMRTIEAMVQLGAASSPAESLANLGIRYVVLHKMCLDQANLQSRSMYLQAESFNVVYDDEWIRAFLVPGSPVIGRMMPETGF